MTKEERHRPFCYENEDSNTMVIFIHGVIEGPNQFKEFAKIAYKYFSESNSVKVL